jgi:signal transduction histidine kinase
MRLRTKIYLTILASLALVMLFAGAFWRLGPHHRPPGERLDIVAELVSAVLPPANAPRAEQEEAIRGWARRLDADLALFYADRRLIASSGRIERDLRPRHGWHRGPAGPAWSIRLPDRRWLMVADPPHRRNPVVAFILFLGGVVLAVGVGAYPVVRGLTGRLERLQAGVETFAAGELDTRVKVEGRDEVARLAESFNRAAAKIEELVGAHRLLLANASHELRTPLARIRLGIELLKPNDPARQAELERDIAELDGLIDEILLASRLDAIRALELVEPVDLLALIAEEVARTDGATLDGVPGIVTGDPRLLRRLVRNLLDNAHRHGAPPIAVELRSEAGTAIIDVTDAGDGIPEGERERVFTPFHRLPGSGAEGFGLGLSLVRQIARLHGGDAVIAARDGQRSCFRVLLPLA